MYLNTKEKIDRLLIEISALSTIKAIGNTGDNNNIPIAGEADIDIFVFGENVPCYEDRKTLYDNFSNLYENCFMNVCEGGVWGTGDIFIIDGIETMLMYFRIDETITYLDDVLAGKYLDCENGFYPVGRCATLKNMDIIYDDTGVLASIKDKLSTYPDPLRTDMSVFHLQRVLDKEGFERAVLRKDVLYYHHVLEASLDHFLQALYAINRTYFPSRKRTEQYIKLFPKKPVHCYEKLLKVIELGAAPDNIKASYELWCELVSELHTIYDEELI